MKLEKTIPFDQYSRQHQVRAVFNLLRNEGGQVFDILDVGGYKGHTQDFLINDRVTVMDLYDATFNNYVKGSALNMPFDDRSFDYVVSFDVLEHIPPDKRTDFFDECSRVAKYGIIICAPHNNIANQLAENNLNTRYKSLHRRPHRWLKEHIEYVIPDFERVAEYARSKEYKTVQFFSNKVQLWAAMQEAIFLNSKYPLASENIEKLNLFYNTHILYDGGGRADSAYRSILCCVKDGVLAEKLELSGPLSEPIDSALEVELIGKIGDFNTTLVRKTTTLANNYKRLYEYEKYRADILDNDNKKLQGKLDSLNNNRVSRLWKAVRAMKYKTTHKGQK